MNKLTAFFLIALFVTPFFALDHHRVRTYPCPDGRLIDVVNVPGIPPEQRIAGPIATPSRNAVMLNGVPAFDWCYGCSATSGAMMAGYYDRGAFAQIYTGPVNAGMVPLNNSAWGPGECTLSATHMGYDGLAGSGHVDRFWTNNSGNDPFGPGDPTGTYWGCTADYMGTNQQWWGNSDGSTTFAYYVDGSPLYDPGDGESGPPYFRDGIHGLRLFFQSRNYAVSVNYNQYIQGWDGNEFGYTLAQFRASIDAGIPVMIQIEGHSMVGVGYESASSTIYIHNTWDHSLHSMTWGATYSNMAHYGVGVLELIPPPQLQVADPSLSAILLPDDPGEDSFTIHNAGGGPLSFEIVLQTLRSSDPDGSRPDASRNITGSTLSVDAVAYYPGTTANWTLSLYNGSNDDEWLKDVYLTIPPYVHVVASNFTGGGGGDMIPDQAAGTGITLHWHGESGGWGVVYPGNTAVASLNISIPEYYEGSLVLPYQIHGDVYGSEPHVLNGQLVIPVIPALLPWCRIAPVMGELVAGADLDIYGYFNALDLIPGIYTADLELRSNDPVTPILLLSVSLQVRAILPPETIMLQKTPNGVRLTWDPVPGAMGYKIYRSELPDSGFYWVFTTELCSYEEYFWLPQLFYRISAEY